MGDVMYEKVLENIRDYIEKTGLSIDQLAEKTNLSSTYLKSLVKGTRKNPSLDTIYKLSIVFNVDMMELIGIK